MQQHAQRERVGGGGPRATVKNLGCEVELGAGDLTRRAAERGEAEVDQNRPAVGVDQDVDGFKSA